MDTGFGIEACIHRMKDNAKDNIDTLKDLFLPFPDLIPSSHLSLSVLSLFGGLLYETY